MNSLEYSTNTTCTTRQCNDMDEPKINGTMGSNNVEFATLLKSYGQKNEGNNTLLPCEYTIDKSLGKGVFGEVFQATAADGHLVALKRITKNGIKFDTSLVNREVEVGKRLQGHAGIARLESYFETLSNVYLVFEFVDGSDLFKLMEDRGFRPLSEGEARNLCSQIVDSLIFVHSHKVAHRDIKLDNILLDSNGNTRIIDLGLASMDEDEMRGCRSFVGSPEYVAPEIIKRKPYSGYKADVYSLGMVLYCLLFGQFPFIPEKRFEAVLNGEPHPLLEWPDQYIKYPSFNVSKTAKELLSEMLEVDPKKRITMEQIAKHHWLNENSTNNIVTINLPKIPKIPNEIDVC